MKERSRTPEPRPALTEALRCRTASGPVSHRRASGSRVVARALAWAITWAIAWAIAWPVIDQGTPSSYAQPRPASHAGPNARVTPPDPQHVTAAFFRELGEPGARRVEKLLAQAQWQRRYADRGVTSDWENACRRARAIGARVDRRAHHRTSIRTIERLARKALVRRARLDNALARLERARALDPDDPLVAFHIAEILARWEEPGPLWACTARRRTDEAIAAYQRVQEIAPDYLPALVASELAGLYTRKHAFRQAARAHQRALALSLDAGAQHMTNLAEVTMLAGDLEGALARYHQALRKARDDRERALALWGMAVVLDRLGEPEAARHRASQAVQVEGGRMQLLRSPGVFFEPRHELSYYEALGHEARAELFPEEADYARQAAVDAWREYLAQAPDDDPFTENARANLARLDATGD